ncbi:hypothetical protein [Halorussus sp. MSC15.2]|uniref:hypothetical protein n=1 Tax=Halorussus sp. MSC15.2 TaxID=2283638 RepID=UPI0013D4713C|nr:hypothetical protein [Halorussus sp. MSC15.2]NEU58436.1 hypothetical protein [Halorussus sp. MSC15.2]
MTCPDRGDEKAVSCVTDHPRIDLRPTIAPLRPETTNQSFVFRNRMRTSVTVNTAGIDIFRRGDRSWKEIGNQKRNLTASIVKPGDAFYWIVKFPESRESVLIRDGEVRFPKEASGQYAATITATVEEGQKLQCGTVFRIE